MVLCDVVWCGAVWCGVVWHECMGEGVSHATPHNTKMLGMPFGGDSGCCGFQWFLHVLCVLKCLHVFLKVFESCVGIKCVCVCVRYREVFG